jgi:hypothetical protein
MAKSKYRNKPKSRELLKLCTFLYDLIGLKKNRTSGLGAGILYLSRTTATAEGGHNASTKIGLVRKSNYLGSSYKTTSCSCFTSFHDLACTMIDLPPLTTRYNAASWVGPPGWHKQSQNLLLFILGLLKDFS